MPSEFSLWSSRTSFSTRFSPRVLLRPGPCCSEFSLWSFRAGFSSWFSPRGFLRATCQNLSFADRYTHPSAGLPLAFFPLTLQFSPLLYNYALHAWKVFHLPLTFRFVPNGQCHGCFYQNCCARRLISVTTLGPGVFWNDTPNLFLSLLKLLNISICCSVVECIMWSPK